MTVGKSVIPRGWEATRLFSNWASEDTLAVVTKSPISPTSMCMSLWRKTSGQGRIWTCNWKSVTQASTILITLKNSPYHWYSPSFHDSLKKYVQFPANNLVYVILSRWFGARRRHSFLKITVVGIMLPVWLAPLSLWRVSVLTSVSAVVKCHFQWQATCFRWCLQFLWGFFSLSLAAAWLMLLPANCPRTGQAHHAQYPELARVKCPALWWVWNSSYMVFRRQSQRSGDIIERRKESIFLGAGCRGAHVGHRRAWAEEVRQLLLWRSCSYKGVIRMHSTQPFSE